MVLNNEIDELIREAEAVKASFSNLSSITEQQKNVFQASSKADKLSPKEIMDTMILFTNDARRSAPTTQVFGPVISKSEANIKTAGSKVSYSEEERRRVLREFTGLV